MKIETIAARKHDRQDRMAGTYESALRITVGDLTGVGYFRYEYDKRDVMAETLTVEPRIAHVVRQALPEEGPAIMDGIFVSDSTGDANKITEALDIATVTVHDYR